MKQASVFYLYFFKSMYKSTINEELNAVGFLLESHTRDTELLYVVIIKAFFFLLSWLYGVKRDITIIHK